MSQQYSVVFRHSSSESQKCRSHCSSASFVVFSYSVLQTVFIAVYGCLGVTVVVVWYVLRRWYIRFS